MRSKCTHPAMMALPTCSLLMTLAMLSKAYHYFGISSNEQKRELINFVFSNLTLNGGNLEYALRSPFHLFTNLTTRSEWLGD